MSNLTEVIASNQLSAITPGDFFYICKALNGDILIGLDTTSPVWVSNYFGFNSVFNTSGYDYNATVYNQNGTTNVIYMNGFGNAYVSSFFSTSSEPFASAVTGTYFLVMMTTLQNNPPTSWADMFSVVSQGVSCFNKGTMIECAENTFRPVEDLRKGDIVKTLEHGYRPIRDIGFDTMYNCPKHFNLSMYQSKVAKETFQPLVVTGGHAILFNEEEYAKLGPEVLETNKRLFKGEEHIIDNHHLVLVAAIPHLFEQITEENKEFTYYHFTVAPPKENNDDGTDNNDDVRFGVYANGWLTETPSHNQFASHKYRGVY